jgi:hypothetical protein
MLTSYKRGQGDAEISDETTPTKRLLVGLGRQGRSEGVEFSSLVWVLMRWPNLGRSHFINNCPR